MKRKPFITRVVAALLVLILPWIVEAITRAIASKEDSDNFWKCYSEAKPKIDFSGFELDEDSGDLSGKLTDSKSVKTNDKDNSVVVKTNCGLFHGSDECKNGRTSSHSCKWVPVGSGGYCTEGDKIKRKCTDMGLDKGITCKQVDDYGKACIETEPSGNSKPGCGYKKEATKCETKGISTCKGTDDYGSQCEWKDNKCISK